MGRDPLRPLGRNDECWCGTGQKYKRCHGAGPASVPGAAVPEDDEDSYWISPTTKLARGALVAPTHGVPITIQEDRPVAGPLYVPRYAEAMAKVDMPGGPTSLQETGRHRYDVLTDYGLDEPTTLGSQLDALPDDALADVADELAKAGRWTLDLLASNAAAADPRSVLWTDQADVPAMVGQTVLWADHYLTHDGLLDEFLEQETPDRARLLDHLTRALATRPLVEGGLVVPVPTGAAVLQVADLIGQSTERSLTDPRLVQWVDQQLVIEGPTAREVVFVSARDDNEQGFYTHAKGDGVRDDGSFEMALLQPYDPSFDYSPWISTVRKQYVARLTQSLNTDLVVAGLFGGEYVTRTPFRARLASRTGTSTSSGPSALLGVDVPWLPEADVSTLAKLAAEDEAVADLRRLVAKAIRRSRSREHAVEELQSLIDEIAEEAAGPLSRRIQRDMIWRKAVPGVCAAGTVMLGATAGPLGALAGAALGAGMWAGPALADHQQARANAPFVFWLASRKSRST